MGCFSSKSKSNLESTKPVEIQKSNIVAPLTEIQPSKPIERNPNKHKNPNTESLLIKEKSVQEAKTAEIITREKTTKEYEQISTSLSAHFLFNSLSSESIASVIEEIKLYNMGPKEIVFTQGSPGMNFYIISQGRCEVIVNSKTKKLMSKGEQFGELALLHDSPRTATVVTVEKTALWVLSREAFSSAIQSINNRKYEENKQFIANIPTFNNFSSSQKDILLSMIATHEFNDGQKIVTEGDPGNVLYFIKKGTVVCTKSGQEIRKLSPGDFFGEQALLYNTQRTATVTAIGKVTLLSLGRDDLTVALGSHLQQIIYRNSQRIAIEKSKVLKVLTKSQVEGIIDTMEIACYKAGQIVVGRGSQKSKKVYFVLKGTLRFGSKTQGLYTCIGDDDTQKNSSEAWEDNWIADVDSDIAILEKDDLEQVIGGHLGKIASQNEVLSVLRRVQLLRSLPIQKLENLVCALKIYEYKDGQIIFKEGDIGDAFYIVKEGQVEIFKGDVSIRIITRHDFFGDRSIIQNENRTATVVSRGKAVCWSLSKKDFLSMIDEGIRKQLTKRIELQNDQCQISDLIAVKLLGRGMFGNVLLTYNIQTKVYYALKTVQRNKITAFDIYDNLLLERKILLQVDHPLIIKLVKTFKDEFRVYFLMEFVQGIDLFDALRELGLLNNESARFYIACLMLIFEHLHERSIIYRDLKPENIMIDPEGYPKLIDFGTSKILKQRTFTMVGTPHYMAPEIIKGTGYTLAADIWSIGIMLYEFVCGCVPFGENEEETFKIYSNILERNLKYPNYMSSTRCKPIIEKLLDPNPVMRGTIESLKEHSWLNGVSWDALLGKQLKPPYVPKADNFTSTLQKAIRVNRSLADIVQHYEMEENFNDAGKSANKIPPSNWDDEF
ncbi:hypothetical protein SteCoe_30697 [Stentor coeruleus]|uniref:cGMP-dependent protein kinase n=1 Tax=Stentor coeruleus TaxID=5963 RepID=A0A1R2B3B4_9CILI|nr:hypothetical protein SteCoe_30697 [Stentor coeruleus]